MHITRLRAPKTWPIVRKELKWITKPLPGPHSLEESITINLILRDILKYAKTTKEVKNILNQGKIAIDGKVRKDSKFPVGIMDVISIKDTNEYYRLVLNQKGKFILLSIKKEESLLKPKKIRNKTILKGKKVQLNFFDGTNLIVPKDIYKVSDTLIFDINKNEIKDHLKFEKNALIYVFRGNKVGTLGVISEIKTFEDHYPTKIIFKTGKETFETKKDYVFVIGKDKPIITVQEK